MKALNLMLFLVLFAGTQDAAFAKKKLYSSVSEAVKAGEMLWNDAKLSTNGKKCTTCHANGALLKLDKPFPKVVRMAGGVLTLDQIINFCMAKPMKSKAFPSDAPELAAMAAYHESMAKRIK